MQRITLNTNLTVQSTLDEMLLEKKLKGLVEKTLFDYSETVKQFLIYIKEGMDSNVSIINKQNYQKWLQAMMDKNISPASINHYLTSFRVYVKWLAKNNYIDLFDISLVKCQQEKLDIYTEDDLRILLAPRKYKRFSSYRDSVIIAFIASTGARASSITNLKWDDIDFKERLINFSHTKNKQALTVPMSDGLTELLMKYKKSYSCDSDYVFVNEYGQQMTTIVLNHGINKYCQECGVKPRGVHAFRHFFAKAYLMNGGSVFHLQKILGHSDMQMTRKYVHLFTSDIARNYSDLCPLDNLHKKQQ